MRLTTFWRLNDWGVGLPSAPRNCVHQSQGNDACCLQKPVFPVSPCRQHCPVSCWQSLHCTYSDTHRVPCLQADTACGGKVRRCLAAKRHNESDLQRV